jgi:hypothetical protein
MSLLIPGSNFGIDVTVSRRVRTRDEYGETSNETDATVTKVIWAELKGYQEYRTKNGRKLVEVVEVHLLDPTLTDLVPGQDFFTLNGVNYRIMSRVGMERMVGTTQYTVTREDK